MKVTKDSNLIERSVVRIETTHETVIKVELTLDEAHILAYLMGFNISTVDRVREERGLVASKAAKNVMDKLRDGIGTQVGRIEPFVLQDR